MKTMHIIELIIILKPISLNVVQRHAAGIIGDNSCFEYGACYQKKVDGYFFNVGNDSCRGQAACSYLGEGCFAPTSNLVVLSSHVLHCA